MEWYWATVATLLVVYGCNFRSKTGWKPVPHLPQPRAYPCCPEPRTLDPLTAPATSPRRQRLTPSPIPPDNCWSTRRCKWSGGIPASNCSAAFSCTRHRAVGWRAVKLRPPPRPAPAPPPRPDQRLCECTTSDLLQEMTPLFYVPGFTTPPISLTRSTTAGAGAVWVWRTVLFAMSCNVRHLGVSRAWLGYARVC